MQSDGSAPAEYRPAGPLDASTALSAYRGPWSLRLAAHLLRRAGFGGTPQAIADAVRAGMDATVDGLIRGGDDRYPAQPQGDIDFPRGPGGDKMQRRNAIITTQLWWLDRCLLTPNPLHERMVYFWSNHFTSGIGQKGITPQMMVDQYALFRRHALGSFAQLTHEVARDPAMLHYLDGITNRAQHPNENFARELMELFTMGVGNYSEDDVRMSARAFTGGTVDRFSGQYLFNPRRHDDGSKTFLGRSGDFGGDDIVDIIMDQRATARFVARKFLRAFVYDDPEPQLVEALADGFRGGGYDTGQLLGTLLRSNIFYSQRAYRALVKSPLELVIGALKTLGASGVGARTLGALVQMGQIPMQPPNVAGWPGGQLWLNTGTYLARVGYLHQLAMFNPAMTGGAMSGAAMAGGAAASGNAALAAVPAGMDPQVFFSPADHLAAPETWVGGVGPGDPLAVAEHLLDAFVQGDATGSQMREVLDYLRTDGVGNRVLLSGENFEEKLRGGASLAMALPAYELA